MDYECIGCGTTFKRYSTIQRYCGSCSLARSSKKLSKPRTPLKRAAKPIKQRGKEYAKWVTFRDMVAKPYLDKKFGRICAVEGCPETEHLDVDHIKGRGSHPGLRYDVTNLRYLCRPHHIARTSSVGWNETMRACR